jgi:hypothetical protein
MIGTRMTGGVKMIVQHTSHMYLTVSRWRRLYSITTCRGAFLLLAILGLAACVNPSPDQTDISSENTETAASTGAQSDEWIIADYFGIAVKGVRLTAAGNVLDLRYKVTDIEKASAVLSRQSKPYVLVEKSGAKLGVPVSYKLGPLRQSTTHPEDERIYFTFFANPGHHVNSGDTIRLVVDDYTTMPLIVQ